MKKNRFNKKCFVACLTALNTACLSCFTYDVKNENISQKLSGEFDKKYLRAGIPLLGVAGIAYLLLSSNRNKVELNIKGNGDKTVVIVHAFGCVSVDEQKQIYNTNYSEDYDLLTNMLVKKGFRTVVINRLGYGESDDVKSPRTNENIVKEMSAALKEHNINPPYILMGHSMGNLFCLKWIASHASDISAYIGLDGMSPYYYYRPTMKKCPDLPDPKTSCPALMELRNKKLISNGMYQESLYQNQNMYDLHDFKFPNQMPVTMFLSKQLQSRFNEIAEDWKNSDQLVEANEKLFSDNNNQKVKCLDDGDHFLYRSKKHTETIVNEIERISSKQSV